LVAWTVQEDAVLLGREAKYGINMQPLEYTNNSWWVAMGEFMDKVQSTTHAPTNVWQCSDSSQPDDKEPQHLCLLGFYSSVAITRYDTFSN